MIDPNYRPSDEKIFDRAMERKVYPYLAMRLQLNPEQREKILEMNRRDGDDIVATMLALEMDIEHDIAMNND